MHKNTLLTFVIILVIGLGVSYFAGLDGVKVNGFSVFFLCGVWAFAVNIAGFIPATLNKTEKIL